MGIKREQVVVIRVVGNKQREGLDKFTVYLLCLLTMQKKMQSEKLYKTFKTQNDLVLCYVLFPWVSYYKNALDFKFGSKTVSK